MDVARLPAFAQTVVHVRRFFTELKAVVREHLAAGRAAQRGYFTPSEDEALRRLLISYSQARAALLEIAIAYRDDEELQPADRPAAFLTAFAAACVLVDAGRFLHESFDDRPLVRAKLNEPEPHFGIPPGTYDSVQRSLASVRQAWHLYHALQYWEAEQATLRQLEGLPSAQELLSTIDDLVGRLNVPAARFAHFRVREQIARRRSQGRTLLQRALYGIQKTASGFVSHLFTRPGHRPTLPPKIAAQVRELLQPGDVLLTRKEYALTNYFLPGYWPHAALYLGGTDELARLGLAEHANVKPRWANLLSGEAAEPRVLEAMGDGVRIRPLSNPFKADSVVLLRPQLEPAQIAEGIGRGMFHEGKPYDFDFDFSRSDRLVCTEVVYRAYDGLGPLSFPLQRRAGRLTLAAEDLLHLALERRGLAPVAVYALQFGPHLQQGSQIDELLAHPCGPAE